MFHRLSRVLRTTQIAALLILLGLGAALYHYLSRFDIASEWVDHHHEVVAEIGRARLEVLRTGIWLRNHVVDPQPRLLTLVRSSALEASAAVLRLQALVRDDPQQQRNAGSLAVEMETLLTTYLSSADVAEREGAEALQPLLALITKADATQRVRNRLNAMERHERGLLEAWSTDRRQQLAEVKSLLLLAAAVVAGALLWSMWYSEQILRLGRRAEAQLKAHAAEDPLTGLLNRRELDLRLERLAQRVAQGSEQAAVLMFDLDDFKPVNDSHGHAAGDEVLRTIGERLRQQCRERDLIARLGGDEFVVVLNSVPSLQAALGTAERIRAAVQEPIDRDGVRVQVGASIGVAMLPADGLEPERLLQRADDRLYAAKHAGKGQIVAGLPQAA